MFQTKCHFCCCYMLETAGIVLTTAVGVNINLFTLCLPLPSFLPSSSISVPPPCQLHCVFHLAVCDCNRGFIMLMYQWTVWLKVHCPCLHMYALPLGMNQWLMMVPHDRHFLLTNVGWLAWFKLMGFIRYLWLWHLITLSLSLSLRLCHLRTISRVHINW